MMIQRSFWTLYFSSPTQLRLRLGVLLLCFAVAEPFLLADSPAEALLEAILLDDQFESLRPGNLMPVIGPHTEYHFYKEAIAAGPWSVTTFESGSDTQVAWRAVRTADGQAALHQMSKNKDKHWHPMVVAGNRAWQDYLVRAKVWVENIDGRFGVGVRQRNDRCYYFVGYVSGQAVLMLVQHETDFRVPGETILAAKPISLTKNQSLSIEVTCVGDQISAQVGDVSLTANDTTYPTGNIVLLADVPTRFDDVRVTSSAAEVERVAKLDQREAEAIALLADQHPKPKLWKKISTLQFGVERNIRFGDLNADGRIDLLLGQILHHGPTDSNSELACLTAIDLDGQILWQLGTPDRWRHHLTNDTPLQIHDLDHDGRPEVIYCMNQELIVADGATGKRLQAIPTPENKATRVPFNRFPRVLGDSLLVADFRGQGFRGDILLKDRYQQAWAFDSALKPLWQVECTTGHFPFPIDTDKDGREELSLGYSRFAPDGKLLWSHDDRLEDHADSVAVVDLEGDGSYETLIGASDEGFLLLDAQGVPRVHLRVGHVQNITVAELRPDLPGLEIAIANFWKNQGIVHLLDRRGNILYDFEPRPEHGSTLIPVHWKGDGVELLLVNPDPLDGGLFDGFGRRIVALPADGHPTRAYDALDLTGDARDEIIVWDAQEIWIYTQDTTSNSAIASPMRNSRSNESNYRARVSLPAQR